jgi:nicotinamide-nucleotide amidase
VVSYNNSVKQALLNVPQEMIAKHGAVSAEVVRIMAREARSRIGATFGVAVSGVAGPDGGSAEKPVGTFFVGVSGPQGAREVRCFYPGERATVRMYATYVALDLIRRELEAFPIPDGYPLVSRQ